MSNTQTRSNLCGVELSGRYRVERLLGRGGFAEVYLAHHMQIPSLKVAVKVLHPVHRERAAILRRFKREAGVLALLRNRHTVRLIDFGFTSDETPYLVMEYVDGAPLDRVLRRHLQLRESDTARIAIGSLKALAEAHALGVVHRDLKPGNIFLVNEPGEQHALARVLDFGVAKVMGDEDVDLRHAARSLPGSRTRTDTVFCTPLYAAPEVLRGSPSFQADLYALGLVMAELLDGSPPYAGAEFTFEASPHLARGPVPLGPRAASSALADVIRRAVAKPLDQRYLTAEEMLADTQAALAALLAARGDEAPLMVAPPSPRVVDLEPSPHTDTAGETLAAVDTGDILRASASAEAAVPMLTVRARALDSTGETAAASPAPPLEAPPRPKAARNPLVAIGGAVAAVAVVGALVWATTSGRATDASAARPEPASSGAPAVALPAEPDGFAAPLLTGAALDVDPVPAFVQADAVVSTALLRASNVLVDVRADGPGALWIDGTRVADLVRNEHGDGWTTPPDLAAPVHRPVEVRVVGRTATHVQRIDSPGPVVVDARLRAPSGAARARRADRVGAQGGWIDEGGARAYGAESTSAGGTRLLGPPVAPRTR